MNYVRPAHLYRVLAKVHTMKALILLLGWLIAQTAFAQTTIRGTVTDAKGEPIPGANIFLVDTYDGATSKVDGNFSFVTEETGEQTLLVKFIGYKDFTVALDLTNQPVTVLAVLREAINELETVVISAGFFAASDESRRTIFKALDIATTAGATADIAGALNTLPGTQKVGEEGRLFVRGGSGNEARTFIDGMLVLDPYGPSAPNTPTRQRFLPFMFKGTSFSTGGYSAEFGQAMSAALVLESKDEEQFSRTDFGFLSVGLEASHTHAWEKASVAGKLSYTNMRPYVGLINQEVDWIKPPVSLESSAVYRQRTGKNGMFKIYGNLNRTELSLYQHSIEEAGIKVPVDQRNQFAYLNSSFQTELNTRWSMHSGLAITSIGNRFQIGQVKLTESDKSIHAKSTFTGTLTEQIELRTGAEVIYRPYSVRADTSAFKPGFDETITAGFAEADIMTSKHFVARTGLRLEHNSLLQRASADPRISLAYKAGKSGQVSFAYGRFRQSAAKEYLRLDNQLDNEKASHYIINYQMISNNRTFRVEAYYKQYDDLVKFQQENRFQFTNAGTGYAKGIELFWRDNKTFNYVDYWISYSFLETERDYLNTPYAVMPSFASRHNFSIVYKHFVPSIKSQLGLTYSFTSPRPYNNPNDETFNNGRTPAYHDLSANISYLPKPHLIIYLSCTNLLGYENIFGYEFSPVPDAQGVYASRPIGQPAPRFLFLGVFLTLSKNKAFNQLPSL
ncbi:MAG: TonB-dependent receptor [Cyclobacteriaceae bacterium]|nr:TonB-dependent receptor [Cyclobacteriaceae bacterium]